MWSRLTSFTTDDMMQCGCVALLGRYVIRIIMSEQAKDLNGRGK